MSVVFAYLGQKPSDTSKKNSARVVDKLVEVECRLVGQCEVHGGHRYETVCVSFSQIFLHNSHQILPGKNRENLEKPSFRQV